MSSPFRDFEFLAHPDYEPDPAGSTRAGLAALIAAGGIDSDYQPIVELDSGVAVAYEALSRGPRGTALESPTELIAAARRHGLLSELDLACREAALAGARDARMHSMWTLFVNTEPDSAASAFGAPGFSVARGEMNVVVELTERALGANPVELLHLVNRIRAHGWGIALDDVGANRVSLAVLPILRPDVIKLDMRLVQERTTGEIVEIVGAVNAAAERSGGVVVAEGIETDEHLFAARALGATHGQGYLFGRPGPLPRRLPAFTGTTIAVTDRCDERSSASPFELGAAVRTPRTGNRLLLTEFSRYLERQAMTAGRAGIMLATFQHASLFSATTRARYAAVAGSIGFAGVLAQDMELEPLSGVRGGHLDHDDPLVDEWDVVVISPHFAATLVARELGSTDEAGEPLFTFVLSHDRELAVAVAGDLMARISPAAEPDPVGPLRPGDPGGARER